MAGASVAPFYLRKPFRIVFGLGAPLAAMALVAFLYFADPLRNRLLACPTYLLTGLYCPGCGTTRMLHDLLHLRLLSAFGHNPLIFLLSPLIGYYLLRGYLRLVLARPVLPDIRLPGWATVLIGVSVLLFTVARNLPYFPLTLLAP